VRAWHRSWGEQLRDSKEHILLLAPAYLIILFTFVYPVARLLQLATVDISTRVLKFRGLENLLVLFRDKVYHTALLNNALMLLIVVPALVLIAVLIAVLLFELGRGWKAYRFLLFLPYIIATPVIGLLFSYLLRDYGVINTLLTNIGLGGLALGWLTSLKLTRYTLMAVIVWKEMGLGIVIFLARLMSVDPALFEVSQIDGASWLQRLSNVTIPQLRSVIEFYTILSTITVLSWVFNYVYVLTNGGPGTSTYVMEFYIYMNSFRYGLSHIASTAALVLLAMVTILILGLYRVRGGLLGGQE
jgi:ABC-type sugar transport system permease subunit